MDIKKIKAIIELVQQSGVAELEIVEGEEALKIRTNNTLAPNNIPNINYGLTNNIPQNNSNQAIVTEVVNSAPSNAKTIKSPMVGTFYAAPSPTSSKFVSVGQNVKKGQVLCIIEAMKLMNQIEAEQDGTIKEVLLKDGDPVEYGQPLFIID